MQGVNTGESGAPNGEQGMRTQEIHIVSSNAHRQAYASMQNQRLQKQFEPMTFSNTPFPAEKEGHRRGKAESTPPVAFRLRRQPDRHRFGSDAAFVDRQPCNQRCCFRCHRRCDAVLAFPHSVQPDLVAVLGIRGHIPPPCYGGRL